ncbi:hypothetical protein KBB48_00235 [Candidatus Shapirobacteria bacterium]|nr:hypothetical protein [Candidatus Shapirobacteria bacterium]
MGIEKNGLSKELILTTAPPSPQKPISQEELEKLREHTKKYLAEMPIVRWD